ncbi:MAG TPA: hypothetical protein VG984_03390 [Candidatus Paceibacterota bacterium]|nr:hypothetical protein [Candidatus Paceibacterota bacterium]
MWWGTAAEIEFLERLKKENPEAFQNYKDTFHLRTKWSYVSGGFAKGSSIDPNQVAAFLETGIKPGE